MSESQNKPSRRGFMWGAAAVGAAAAAVTTLPKTQARKRPPRRIPNRTRRPTAAAIA